MNLPTLPAEVAVPATPVPMVRGAYAGPVPGLNGQTALLMALADRPGKVAAQFDNRELVLAVAPPMSLTAAPGDTPDLPARLSTVHLGYGWHEFSIDDFLILKD